MAMAIDRIIQGIFLVTYLPSFGFVANQAESRGKTEITKRIGDGTHHGWPWPIRANA